MSLAQYEDGYTLQSKKQREEVRSMTDSNPSTGKSTIMVVDDNPDIVELLCKTLEEKGFNVRCAYNGKDLFAGMKELKPDLILLDIMMPQMDGLEALNRLKGDRGTASIPVILLTAKTRYEDVIGGYKMGAEYYITKPYTVRQLFTGINFLLSGGQGDSLENP
jgi:DNA-binding response OmpR family regulator